MLNEYFRGFRDSSMALQVELLVAMLDDLNLSPGTYIIEGEDEFSGTMDVCTHTLNVELTFQNRDWSQQSCCFSVHCIT